MLVSVDGALGRGVTAKDVVLAVIGSIGTAGGTGMRSSSPAARSVRCPWKAA